MRMKWSRFMGVLLLCVYAVAIVHQILPHDADHGHGESCSLCLLLVTTAVIVAGAALVAPARVPSPTLSAPIPPCSRTLWSPFSLRGPPRF